MDITEAVAATLRAEMAAQRIGYRQLSATSGVPERTLARMLKPEREIKLAMLASLASALGLPVHEIMRRAEQRLTDANKGDLT